MTTAARTTKILANCGIDRAPGVALCVLIAAFSVVLQAIETSSLGHPYVEAVVLAILLGMTIRAFWQPGRRWSTGIAFSAKQLLEIAVMLLGASLSLAAIAASGALLLGAVIATVVISLVFGYGVSRMLGLSRKMSILIACGNSICGNSAIAAVAPVIGANSDDVGASISFTAILGVLTVLGLPLLVPLFDLSATQYGILAGLTVYAVPQVLAATVPIGFVSTQIGTLVKLIRVLMLGPVVVALSIFARSAKQQGRAAVDGGPDTSWKWVPWFIPGFLLFATLRSFDLIPSDMIPPIANAAKFLTIVSMAALGLGVDLTLIGRVGVRVTTAVTLSLVALTIVSLVVVRLV
jgi:uncharacterized integral membrane protein (TIGR00698 family)